MSVSQGYRSGIREQGAEVVPLCLGFSGTTYPARLLIEAGFFALSPRKELTMFDLFCTIFFWFVYRWWVWVPILVVLRWFGIL